MLSRKPYPGDTRQLVLAFDIGATCSAVSFCILEPGEVPQLQSVNKYPGQAQVCDSKIPSVMYYDSKGNVKAAGYEALEGEAAEMAMDENWVKLEWWKLHLRPKHVTSANIKDTDLPPLPNGKSIIHIFRDFIKYLFQCAEIYIQESYPSCVWQSVKEKIQFVFTHPNGWENAQQQQIRRAIELAGLVPGTPEGRARVRFLAEGEASLYFCIWDLFASGIPNQERYPKGQGVVVVDAGSGVIYVSMYSVMYNPISFEEIAPSECRLQGSVFVTRRAKALFQKKLEGSRYSSPEMIQEITDMFDQTTKLQVYSAEQPAFVRIGSIRENDAAHDIRAGRIKLSGQEVTKLFDDSINAVINAFEQQQRSCVTMPITMAFLVGEFGASDWLWSQLQLYFKSQGIELSRPSRVHKVVPDGAVLCAVNHLGGSRVARATHGPTYAVFRRLLHKAIQVDESKEFRCPFYLAGKTQSEFGVEVVHILCYRGSLPDPQWIDHDEESFSTLCTIRFDLAEVAKTLTPRKKPFGPEGYCYILCFEVIVTFGAGNFSAQVAWKVNGVETRSPAIIIYDEN